MKKTLYISACTLLAVITVMGNARAMTSSPIPKEIADLLAIEEKLNDKCRGGSGDAPKTQNACDERDKIVDQLEEHGWCYGRPDQFGYQKEWQKCENVSSPPAVQPKADAKIMRENENVSTHNKQDAFTASQKTENANSKGFLSHILSEF